MSREHNGLPGLALAPWEEPCTEDAATAADDRAALMALEDAEVYALDGGETQATAVAAAARVLGECAR